MKFTSNYYKSIKITKSKTSFCKPDLPAQSSLLKSSRINQNSKSFYLEVGLATVNPSS